MSYKIIKDASMLFDDSKVAIIPVDSEFNPLSKEGLHYTKIYSIAYRECKREYTYGRSSHKSFCYPIGKEKYIFFLVTKGLTKDYLLKITSLLRRVLNNNDYVSILADNLSDIYLDSVVKVLNCNVKVYDKILI